MNADDELELSRINMRFEEFRVALLPVDPGQFVQDHEGTILRYEDDDEETCIGRVHVTFVDFCTALEEGLGGVDVLDAHSHSAEYAVPEILDPDGNAFSDRLQDLLGAEATMENLLIINSLEILPAHRGRGLGLVICRRLMARFAGSFGVVAMKPFPLQFTPDSCLDEETRPWHQAMKLGSYPRNEEAATAKLHAYFARLGFVRMPGTTFLFRWAGHQLPDIEDLVG